MTAHRAHVLLPDDLIAEIDLQVGPRRRSAFLVETARAELRRRKLLSFLDSREPAWKTADHPEIGDKSGEWVRAIRAESDAGIPVASSNRQARGRNPTRRKNKAG